MIGIKQTLSFFHKFKSLTVVLLITLTLVFTMLLAGCSSRKIMLSYSNDFVDTLNSETETFNNFSTDYANADFSTDVNTASFLKLMPNHLAKFNTFLASYQKPYPVNSPQDLKDAVDEAKEGTSDIIAGMTIMNSALASRSNDQLTVGNNLIKDGADLMDQATNHYNNYVDTFNAQYTRESPNWFLGFVIGTGLVWFTLFVIITPLSKYVTKRRLANQTINGFQFQIGQGVTQVVDKLATRDYILVGVVTFALIGFTVGRTTGMYFIGISWRPKDWPGMLAFIGFSLLGSYLY
jgi:hypothetical protein